MPESTVTSPRPLVGLEIGGTKLQVVAGDCFGGIHRTLRDTVDRAAGGAGIRKRIVEMLRELTGGEGVEAVGVGFGGPVNRLNGDVLGWSHLTLWSVRRQ